MAGTGHWTVIAPTRPAARPADKAARWASGGWLGVTVCLSGGSVCQLVAGVSRVGWVCRVVANWVRHVVAGWACPAVWLAEYPLGSSV